MGQSARSSRARGGGSGETAGAACEDGEHGNEPLSAWVIHVLELDPPKDSPPLEWIVLTNVPTPTREQAFERVDWYQCCRSSRSCTKAAEDRMRDGAVAVHNWRKALEVSIAMFSVVSVQLLRLRDMVHKDDPRAATEVIDEPYVEALSLWRWKERRMQIITAKEFLVKPRRAILEDTEGRAAGSGSGVAGVVAWLDGTATPCGRHAAG